LCSVVEAELYHGAEKYALSEQRRELLNDFMALYHRLPFDFRCVPYYAKVRHHLETHGQIIGANDLLIAATALAHGLTLITHNSGEFARVPGLQWEDWA
jgi:tRNA(fMet)-specific endonuclease VapC